MPFHFHQLSTLYADQGHAVRTWWGRLGHYRQHFIVAVLLGIGIETVIHAAHDFSIVKRVQNAVLDTSLRVFSLRDKTDAPDQLFPVLLAIDDAAAQSPGWGADKSLTLAQALRLVGYSFDRGATHVFLDITFDATLSAQSFEDQEALLSFVKRYSAHSSESRLHLYVARSTQVDPCFPRTEALESLRPSVWDSVSGLNPGSSSGLVIHPVLPHYRADTDHVVRGWDLFGVVRSDSVINGSPSGGWRFLPSPQLAYQVVKRTPSDLLHNLPWLLPASQVASEVTRGTFAAEQVKRLPLLSDPVFSQHLCAHHPHVLGCTPLASHALANERKEDPQVVLAQVNQLMRTLPQEHACRARATELLNSDKEALVPAQPHDLLFNRIVFNLPSWEQAPELVQRGYYLRTPLGLNSDDPLNWDGRLVAIGAAHATSGDWHPTPIGNVPGVLVNLNAMQSLEQIGPVSSPPGWISLLINCLIIVTVAAVFSALSPMAAAALSATILVGSLTLFHQYLLSRGIWIEFGAPLIGINLHRIIDGFLEKRKLHAQLVSHEQMMAEYKRNTPKPSRKKQKGV